MCTLYVCVLNIKMQWIEIYIVKIKIDEYILNRYK